MDDCLFHEHCSNVNDYPPSDTIVLSPDNLTVDFPILVSVSSQNGKLFRRDYTHELGDHCFIVMIRRERQRL